MEEKNIYMKNEKNFKAKLTQLTVNIVCVIQQ